MKLKTLGREIRLLTRKIAREQDEATAEKLKQERMELVACMNRLLGTDHIIPGSRTTTINNQWD